MEPKLLNATQTGKQLGVTSVTVSRWFEDGKFPNGFKVESTLRIPQSDIDALKEAGKAQAKEAS